MSETVEKKRTILHPFLFSSLNLTCHAALVTRAMRFVLYFTNNTLFFCVFLQFFHFSSRAFPPLDGQFTGRIQWQGSPARGDASISLINATLNDNGTYICSVRNPPDVHGSPTSHTVLTVTPKGKSAREHNITQWGLVHFDIFKLLDC